MSKTIKRWNIPVPVVLDEALKEALRKDTHSTKSDFVRDAVRRRLEEMGFKPQVFEGANSGKRAKQGSSTA